MEMLFLFVHIGVREVIPRGNDFSVDPWGGGRGELTHLRKLREWPAQSRGPPLGLPGPQASHEGYGHHMCLEL